MNIGFDAKRIFFNRSGLGNYGRNMLSYLEKYFSDNVYFLFTPIKSGKIDVALSNSSQVVEPQGVNLLGNNVYWRTRGLLNEDVFDKLDVFHGLSNELPIGISRKKVKSILTVHDLIFVRFKEFYNFIDTKIYISKMKKSCAEADRIIAISNQTKNDLIEFLNISPDRINVVYQGCSDIFLHRATATDFVDVKRKYNLPENYILNVGTIEPRKNALLIVKSLLACKIDVPLVLVGRETGYVKKIREIILKNNLQKQVIILNNADFCDFPAIYQGASAFVYPSIFEGFGIPILEAFNSEAPVIVSDIDIFKEVAGEAAMFFKSNDEQSLGEAIVKMLSDNTKRDKFIELGRKRADFFSGKNVANSLMNVYLN